jgi:hypothetical protein
MKDLLLPSATPVRVDADKLLLFADSHQIMYLTVCSTVASGILHSTGRTVTTGFSKLEPDWASGV